MLRKTCSRRNGSAVQRRSTPSITSRRTACLPLRAGSRWIQAWRQTSRRLQRNLVELDRRRVAADVLIQRVEVVLRLLEPLDQVERLGAVADGQGEHLQASLAPLQGVAALVRQPGDDLPDRGQPLRLERPLLCLLEERDVLANLEDRGAPVIFGQVARRSRPSSAACRRGRRPGSQTQVWGFRP